MRHRQQVRGMAVTILGEYLASLLQDAVMVMQAIYMYECAVVCNAYGLRRHKHVSSQRVSGGMYSTGWLDGVTQHPPAGGCYYIH